MVVVLHPPSLRILFLDLLHLTAGVATSECTCLIRCSAVNLGVTMACGLAIILGAGGLVESGLLAARIVVPFFGTFLEPFGLVGLLGVIEGGLSCSWLSAVP